MTDMSRRQFLKTGITLVSGAAITMSLGGTLVGCGGEAAPLFAATLSAAKPVTQWVKEFAEKIGVALIAGFIPDWVSGAAGQFSADAREANNMMQSAGFNVYATSVYQYSFSANTITFYAMGQNTGFDACAPFLRNDGKALVEGPVLMGLALSALNWQSTDVHPADGLLLTKALQNVGSNFNKTEPNPFRFYTPAGSLAIQYSSDTAKQQGLVSVVAKKDNGGELHGEDYLINWS